LAPGVYLVAPPGIVKSQSIDLQTQVVRPVSAIGAAVLPDGRVVFRAGSP
jgi:hypothetical protein